MNTMSLVIASALVLIPIFISYKEDLGLEREIIINILRAVIQLIIIGRILEITFGLEKSIFIVVLVLVMIINAAVNIKKREENVKYALIISFLSVLVGTTITMMVLVLSEAIEFTANEVIPVVGIVVNNSVVTIGLSYRNSNNSFKARRTEIEMKLSLSAGMKDASSDVIKESIKISVIPTIDSAKTLGIVSLPGMVTGLILADEPPLMTIKFQIMVTFITLSSASIPTMTAAYLIHRGFHSKRRQLI